jgi:molecular chaperone DnaK (HSP70)
MGAAIQAAMISGQEVDTVLVDVTPYTYGTSAIGVLDGQPYPFMFVPIIHKNSVLPNRKTDVVWRYLVIPLQIEITHF